MSLLSIKNLTKRFGGVLAVSRFAEDLAAAFGNGIAADHQGGRLLSDGDVFCLLTSQSRHKLRGRFAAADAAFG